MDRQLACVTPLHKYPAVLIQLEICAFYQLATEIPPPADFQHLYTLYRAFSPLLHRYRNGITCSLQVLFTDQRHLRHHHPEPLLPFSSHGAYIPGFHQKNPQSPING